MAISFSNKATIVDQVCNTTQTTGSFTSVTNNYYLVAITTTGTTTISNVTSTNGITFTALGSKVNGTKYQALWGGKCTSGASGTVTVTSSASDIVTISVDEVAGGATSSQVPQTVTAAAATVTLSALAAGSATYLSGENSGLAMTIEAGWTEISNIGTTAKVLTGYKVAGDTTPSWTGTTSSPVCIGIELAALATFNASRMFAIF